MPVTRPDKVGNIVCFYGLAGVSFNFIAMPSSREYDQDEQANNNNKNQHAEFETTTTDASRRIVILRPLPSLQGIL